MLNILEDQVLDDIVSRAEQSRFSYNLQTEEFRNLNTNLQIYLKDIKKIDNENYQLQNNIEQIRTNYIITLENHLKRLPEDFRQESHILTEAHLERYKSKSRAKRFINEREELKKRIYFVTNNEKDQIKRLNHLQRQDRLVHNEFKNLNEQIHNLYNYVENEKQIYQQSMNKVDNLQIQLEQICIERSKTEFEIQTLREEVKLMQTSKEFLDEEHQTILSIQIEANEYLLSHLNESILHIREDFDELNKTQLKQIENQYKKMLKILEENFLNNTTIDETMINHQRTIQIEYEKLQDEHQTITQELTTLNDHNQILSERILAMESDLYSIRDEHMKELIIKDNEFERSKIELQTLNEKLNLLVEYDRNLKFELTLYRGVLENEYRRKQQQQQLINNQQLVRPTTLRTKVLTNRNQLEPIIEKINIQFNEITNHLNGENIENNNELNHQENLSQESNKSFYQNQQEKIESINIISQEEDQTPTDSSKSPISIILLDQLSPSSVQQSSIIPPTNHEPSLTSSAPLLDLSSPSDDRQISSETPKFPTSSTDSTITEDQSASSEVQILPVVSPTNEDTSLINTAPTSPEVHQPPSTPSEDHQNPMDTEKLSSVPPSRGPEISSEGQNIPTTPTISEDQQLSTTSPMDEPKLTETQKSPTPLNNTIPPTDLSPSSEVHQTVLDIQQSPSTSSNEQPMLTESPNTPFQEDQSISSDIQQTVSTSSQEQTTSSEIQQSSSAIADEYQITTNPTDEIDSENHSVESSDGYDNEEEKTKSSTHETEAAATNEIDTNDHRQSTHSIEPSTIEEHEINQTDKQDSSSFDLPSISQDETKQNINSSEDNESILKHDQITTEEQISSSDQNKIGHISSTGYYGTLNDSFYSTNQDLSKQSSRKTSLTDADSDRADLIGEVDTSTSPKNEEKEFDDNNKSNLESVMQDLRYVYRDLINDEDLVEINDDFPNKLIDRLEFGDNLIQTLFDGFLRKYIVQPAKAETRSKTLDWIEFRDILFPILTGRYMEQHIRKLFDLFDTSKDGYLSLQEITELLELLQINDTTVLAQNMINEFDTNQDGKLNVDELIEAVKKADDMNNNILSEETEYKHWYIQLPTDEENNDSQSILLEVPIINFPSKTNHDVINNGINLLSRIFKRIGVDIENKQLDSNKPTLSMKIINEFVNNNINISNDDLQLFIELYLNKKQNSDCFINWIEFRDIFLPFVNDGIFSKDDIKRWFDIFDINHNGIITQQQILHLLRLLQIPNPEEIFNKMNEISEKHTNNNDTWTLEELIIALENINEIKIHLLSNNEQITSFDLNWFTKNVF